MLAARLNSTTEMIKKMGEVSVEPKFDGLRIFIHFKRFPIKSGTSFIKIFTRNMNAIPLDTFPELKEVGKFIKADEAILDSEAIGVDEKREMFLDFQKTIQRRRKHDIAKNSSEIPLQFQVFDIVLFNGKSLINTPYIERREILKKAVTSGSLLRIDENIITKDPEVIKKMHAKYLSMGLEGVVVKKANAGYISGRTGWNWVKMKEVEGKNGRLSDTIDCVVMGYSVGKGKRSGFGIGQFLVGVKDGDIYKTVTKVGTGLTDAQFRELNTRLKKLSSHEKPKEFDVDKNLTPDYWVIPSLVVELAADEITVSPNHTAGLALRFPRLINFRDDKRADQATTIEELKAIYKLQRGK
jgi:DNA ligase-1